MRRINALTTVCVMVLFVMHLIWGAMILCGMIKGGNQVFSFFSNLLIILILVHVLISLKLTFDTIAVWKKTGAAYLWENRLFWIRRVSGLALMLFIAVHMLIFSTDMSAGSPRLRLYDLPALISQILLVVSLLIHLLTNISPLRIALGLRDRGNFRADALCVLAILLLLSGTAFLIYFLRWRVI